METFHLVFSLMLVITASASGVTPSALFWCEVITLDVYRQCEYYRSPYGSRFCTARLNFHVNFFRTESTRKLLMKFRDGVGNRSPKLS